MLHITQLKAALAVVPADQPCTPAAVAALHTAGHAAAQHIAAAGRTVQAHPQLLDDCVEQEVPGACMPVLAWLAAGLRSGLSPAATQQAHEMACALVGVVSRVLPDNMQDVLHASWQVALFRRMVAHQLGQLGTTEGLCQQLAEVAAALLATSFPGAHFSINTTTTTSSSNTPSSSTAAPTLQHQVSLALVWERLRGLLLAVLNVAGQDALVPALLSSGLYQVLLEGALLLLGGDPVAYLPSPTVQQQLGDSLGDAMQVAIFLTVELAIGVQTYLLDGPTSPTSHPHPGSHGSSGSGRRPWLQPLFKLQILLLAKMQWDVRQAPDEMSSTHLPWPANALARALPLLRSPCVAGDLLRQRAPGLVPHVQYGQHLQQTQEGERWVVVKQILCTVPPHMVAGSLTKVHQDWLCYEDAQDKPVADALDLGLLMEVAELYCLVCPKGSPTSESTATVSGIAWRPLVGALGDGLADPDGSVLSSFAATCGEALISIAEYLVEDVLLVVGPHGPSGASSAGRASSTNSSRAATSTSSSSRAQGSRTGATSASSAARSSATTSSSHAQRPVAGGNNPGVTLQHRMAWAREALGALALVLGGQQALQTAPVGQTGAELGDLLFNGATAPRLRLLLETTLRTVPMLEGQFPPLLFLLPCALPMLHAAANSLAGSHGLLSTITTLAKLQWLLGSALAALVEEGGVLVPAAARVRAAMPGPFGRALSQRLQEDPDDVLEAAYTMGLQLSEYALQLMAWSAAVADPLLAPAAAYLATQLLPGHNSTLFGLEWLFFTRWQSAGGEEGPFPYLHLLAGSPQQVEGILQQLSAGLREWRDAFEVKRAAKLAGRSGTAAATKELHQKLVGLWLETRPDTAQTRDQQQVEGGQASSTAAGAGSSDTNLGGSPATEELPGLLQLMCEEGIFQRAEVLAAGDAAQWAAVEPPTSADRRVAATALFMACKLAGAVAQLPQLLAQVQAAAAQQPWGGVLTSGACMRMDFDQLQKECSALADWALLLAPVLGLVMPAEQAARLQEAAAGVSSDGSGQTLVTPDVTSRVLDLLGHVEAPGAPGCSYPGCCSLEGRSEDELPVQVCTRCRGVRYCCREHQVAHWKAGHKEVCQAAQAAAQQLCDVTVD